MSGYAATPRPGCRTPGFGAGGPAATRVLRSDGAHRAAVVRAGGVERVRGSAGSRPRWLSAVLAAAGDRQGRLGALGLYPRLGGRPSWSSTRRSTGPRSIAQARPAGRYQRDPPPAGGRGPGTGWWWYSAARRASERGSRWPQLDVEERRRLLVDGPDGLEPAGFWLSRVRAAGGGADLEGHVRARPTPAAGAQGVDQHAHAHLLRHYIRGDHVGTVPAWAHRRAGRAESPSSGATTPGSSGTRWTGSGAGWVTDRSSPRRSICTRWPSWRWTPAWRWSPTAGKTRATAIRLAVDDRADRVTSRPRVAGAVSRRRHGGSAAPDARQSTSRRTRPRRQWQTPAAGLVVDFHG